MKKYLQITAVIIGTITVLSTAWAIADYADLRPVVEKELASFVETQKQLSDNVLLLRFQVLHSKVTNSGALTFEELQEYCAIARQLQYVNIEMCNPR